jgi:hypothetical protein
MKTHPDVTPPSGFPRSGGKWRSPGQYPLDRIITLLGLLGLALFLSFYDRAFPTAAIDLDLSRAEIARRAHTYLRARAFDVEGYRSALTFTGDSWASYYLQRTLGIPETNRLIRKTQVPVWYWRARWFRPLQKEEFQVYLAPDGQVVALSHTLLEDAPGPVSPKTRPEPWRANTWPAIGAGIWGTGRRSPLPARIAPVGAPITSSNGSAAIGTSAAARSGCP